jgi:tetratricopeptide (TPR) repeat protein
VRTLTLLYLLLLFPGLTQATPPKQSDTEGYVGSNACASCHGREHQAWKNSHHDLAMQEATAETVLGDFSDTEFEYAGKNTVFSRSDDAFWVETEGADGKQTRFRVEYVFGVEPLQQYLLQLPGGRLQALSVSWDSRPASEGGQRWFHLYPDEKIDASDPLHWTGAYQNWNSRCAECHSTNLEKNYDPQTQVYSTTWYELNVGCEACHGPGSRHVQLARSGRVGSSENAGLEVRLVEQGDWIFPPGQPIARRQPGLAKSRQIESCGRCHSRRGTLGEYHYGKNLLDTHRLSLLEEPLYYPDGQIRDEVYVYGSFVQSKMHQAGVVCSNCHEPHSNELRAPGNAVCAQCHLPSRYDDTQHHHHERESAGAQCVECHMPETTYMVVDPRRDHSMRIPRPDLGVVMGTPNACNQCHQDRDAQWAVDSLRAWGTNFGDTGSHVARAMHQAQQGDSRSVPRLIEVASDPQAAPIWRASATLALGAFGNRETYELNRQLLVSDDPLLRMSAVRSLEFLPLQQRWQVLGAHLTDPSKAVRMDLARVLSGVPLDQVTPEAAEQLRALFAEYVASMRLDADMPGVQLQMGTFFATQQQWDAAEQAYLKAISLNSQLLPAHMNLADLYRSLGQEDKALAVLQTAVTVDPAQGAPWHALGLLESRRGNQEAALAHLKTSAELEQAGIRHRYVYAIALNDYGDRAAAISQLQALLRSAPENPEVLLALVNYCRDAGRLPEARRYAEKLKILIPDNPELQALYNSL